MADSGNRAKGCVATDRFRQAVSERRVDAVEFSREGEDRRRQLLTGNRDAAVNHGVEVVVRVERAANLAIHAALANAVVAAVVAACASPGWSFSPRTRPARM